MDEKIFYFINHLPHNLFLDKFAMLVHYLTREGLLYFILAAILLLFKRQKIYTSVKTGLIVGLSTFIINDYILKFLFLRTRPFLVLSNVHFIPPAPTSYSMPSGQIAVAFSLAVIIWKFYPRTKAAYLSFGFALLVGLDRIYMGHHYPSDVLVGVVVGCIISAVIVAFLKRFCKII